MDIVEPLNLILQVRNRNLSPNVLTSKREVYIEACDDASCPLNLVVTIGRNQDKTNKNHLLEPASEENPIKRV